MNADDSVPADPVVAADSGRAVVLLHGFPLSGAMWHEQAHRLTQAGHRVLVVDLPGFGSTPTPQGAPDLSVHAESVVAQMQRAGMARAVVVGLSMGGYVAMELLRMAPDRVEALVLCDTKATADSVEAAALRERIAQSVLAEGSTEALARTMPDTLLGETTLHTRPDLREQMAGWIRDADPAAVAWAQRAMARRPDSLPTLSAARVPSLIVWGEEDAISGWPEQEAMLAALTQGRLARIAHAGHMSPNEQPDAVERALLEFLQSS